MNRVLAIETSCDDTSVAVVAADGTVLALKSVNQDTAHGPFGGIVPELAGRYHTEILLPLIDQVLDMAQCPWSQIDGLAVTARPGLVGSLLVGVLTTKVLALAKNLPFIGINHLEGHLVAPFLKDKESSPPASFDYPYIALAVSGGHTTLYHVHSLGRYDVLGSTVDDAAGEAFDKIGKLLGLGFPGGAKIDAWAKKGNTKAFQFPLPLKEEGNIQMSFSGLKTAALHVIQQIPQEKLESQLADFCASFQEAIVDTLLWKLDQAMKLSGLTRFVVTGGVSANSRLREKAKQYAERYHYECVVPPMKYCTDNAAMIGYAGIQRMIRGEKSNLNLAASPVSLDGDFLV